MKEEEVTKRAIFDMVKAMSARLDDISGDLSMIRGDISEINIRLDASKDAPPPIENILKEKYQDFKEQWKEEAPDMHALKETLVKLKSSLASVLAYPPEEQRQEDSNPRK